MHFFSFTGGKDKIFLVADNNYFSSMKFEKII